MKKYPRVATLAYKTWAAFLAGSGAMLLLIFVPGIAALRQSSAIYNELQAIQQAHTRTLDTLGRIERLMLQASILVREFLLDDSPVTGYRYREGLVSTRRALEESLQSLADSAHPEESSAFDHLRREIDSYWRSITPIFGWSPAERSARAMYFLREEQRPRKEGVLAVADETLRLSRESYRRAFDETRSSQRHYRRQLEIAITAALLVGLGVALWTAVRIFSVERNAERQSIATARAEQQMRSLSARLMQAQEEERRVIARELHDEVGQMLTSLRFELGVIERMSSSPSAAYQQHLAEAKSTAEQTLRTVRDIAIGLRPSVLDLGLESALRWQARQFARNTGTEADVRISEELPELPEPYLTCIYRVVQEALTNSARHSKAGRVEISVSPGANALEVRVEDDGVGLPRDWNRGRGMGLIGMEERVREIGGRFAIASRNGSGVQIKVWLPLPRLDKESA
jgi:signal transduction histidine kinase